MLTKILLSICGCLMGLVMFIMSLGYEDADVIIESYQTTVNGSYTRKHLTVVEQFKELLGLDDSESGGGSSGAATGVIGWNGTYTGEYSTTDPRARELIEKIKEADCSDQRKSAAIWGLEQVGNPNMLYGFGAGHSGGYKTNQSVSLDCSSFMSWIHYNIGADIGDHTTATMAAEAQEHDLTQLYARGERSIGDMIIARGSGGGHVAMVVWVENNDAVYVHISTTGEPPKIGASAASYTSDRNGVYQHVWRVLSDDAPSIGSAVGNIIAGATEKVKVTNPGSLKLPETEFSIYRAETNRKNKLIALDPGHGNPNVASLVPDWTKGDYFDPRGTKYGGETEEEYNLAVALKVKDKLLAAGFDVLMSRDDNESLAPNKLRAKISSEQGAICHVCIHWNANNSNTVSGPLIMLPPDYGSRPWKQANDELWGIMGPKLSAHFGSQIRYPIEASLAVFSVDPNLHILYIETGFVTSATDSVKMHGDTNHEGIADAIASALIEYYS